MMRTALLASLAAVAGCSLAPSDEYRLGDATARYCESADPEVRAAGRVLAARAGTTLPDLCAAHSLVADMEARHGE